MDSFQKPPYSNTGAQNTSKNSVIIDWCGFTVLDEKHAFGILGIQKTDFTELEKGLNGYAKSYILGHIKVYSEGLLNMGCHVEMSGQGCREYEGQGKTWGELIQRVFISNGKFSRLDLALDEYKGLLKMTTMEAKIKRGAVRSKFKKARSVKEYQIEDGKYTGKTIYFGSAQSRVQIRIYDKRLEQLKKGKEDLPVHWIRVEMQARDERANEIATNIIFNEGKTVGKIYKEILNNYLCFLIRNSQDTNKARWKICDWWKIFLNELGKIKLTTRPKKRTYEQIEKWVIRQVAPSLGILTLDSSGNFKSLMKIVDIIENSKGRLKEKDKEIIRTRENEIKEKLGEKKEALFNASVCV